MTSPSRQIFHTLIRSGRSVPVACCLPLEGTAEAIFEAVNFSPPSILLESVRTHPTTGRYSLLVGEPFAVLTTKGEEVTLRDKSGTRSFRGSPLLILQRLLDARPAVRMTGFPPFVGGAVGFLGFDLYRMMEPRTVSAPEEAALPDVGFLFVDEAIVVDHATQKLWIIVLTAPTTHPDRTYDEAVERMETLRRRVTRVSLYGERPPRGNDNLPRVNFSASPSALDLLKATHTRSSFQAMVREAKEFISRGEVYQVNLSQRFTTPFRGKPWDLYRNLRRINPSPFAAFADFFGFQIVSASPERLLRVQEGDVETRPIAGTRRRGNTLEETTSLRRELLLNEKERAEHLMLVDLERNDVGKICQYGSVRVDSLMELEEYSHVIHIVSNVRGIARSNARAIDFIAAIFPGGTITGCPKIRSIEIIDALEPVRRQLYTGSLGYLSFTGDMDLNILIRSAFVANHAISIQTGAGIVADSDPGKEYEETLHKAQALMEALHVDHATTPERMATVS